MYLKSKKRPGSSRLEQPRVPLGLSACVRFPGSNRIDPGHDHGAPAPWPSRHARALRPLHCTALHARQKARVPGAARPAAWLAGLGGARSGIRGCMRASALAVPSRASRPLVVGCCAGRDGTARTSIDCVRFASASPDLVRYLSCSFAL
jgi:hypothetical protein